MGRPSSPRWLAPAALLAGVLAVVVVIGSSGGDEEGLEPRPATPAATTTSGEQERSEGGTQERPGREAQRPARTSTTEDRDEDAAGGTYTVRAGDSFASIAARTGATVAELRELNPDLDPTALQVGDEVRLPE